MEDYVKTGEDKNFEYYRNDSEVLSGDGEEEPYEEIINKKEDFNVKVDGKELKIKKGTLYKIMILSKCQPEEHILFSLYKTVKNPDSQDKNKTQDNSNENINPNISNDLDSLRGAKAITFPHNATSENEKNGEPKNEEKENNEPNTNNNINEKINDPLSSQMYVTGNKNNNSNEPNQNVNVINIPTNEGSDNEGITFKKNDNNENVLVGLPPQAVRAKWFYLLLCLVGIGYIILFVIGLIKGNLITFYLSIIGLFLILTGLFGFNKINKKIYDDNILKIFTYICLIFGVLDSILVILSIIARPFFIVSLILGILTILFSILCIIWTKQLKKAEEETIKMKQMEKLV